MSNLTSLKRNFYLIKLCELKHLSSNKKIKRDVDSIGERIRFKNLFIQQIVIFNKGGMPYWTCNKFYKSIN